MRNEAERASQAKIGIAPMLSVRNGARAVGFYKAAFGAFKLFRLDAEGGAVIAQLSVGEAQFWLADESAEYLNFSPESLAVDGGGSRCRFRADYRSGSNGGLAVQKRAWLANRKNRGSLRTSLGNLEANGRWWVRLGVEQADRSD
jgi:hypothetical protein